MVSFFSMVDLSYGGASKLIHNLNVFEGLLDYTTNIKAENGCIICNASQKTATQLTVLILYKYPLQNI